MQNVAMTIETLTKLKQMGIRIAIDDFGTGYSSLSYIKKYPINTLKIDQSFIRDIMKEKEVITIVKAILELARGLDLDIIAEGVENYDQMELLRSLHCYEMQGYLFSIPLPEKEIAPFIKKGKIVISGIIRD